MRRIFSQDLFSKKIRMTRKIFQRSRRLLFHHRPGVLVLEEQNSFKGRAATAHTQLIPKTSIFVLHLCTVAGPGAAPASPVAVCTVPSKVVGCGCRHLNFKGCSRKSQG
jgi:hypothetical protein